MAKGDLSVTALYTSATWAWGALPGAELFATPDAKRVFDVTNLALRAARAVRPGLSPLPEALLHRHTMIDHLLAEVAPPQVIELAAGLSRRGATVSADPAVRYTEIDLPPMIGKKRDLLARSAPGRAVLARPNLRLVEADALEVALDGHVIAGAPLVVIAEGLFMYLPPEARRRLFARVRHAADAVGPGAPVRFVFDLVPTAEQPPPGRVGRALATAMKRFTGGQGFDEARVTRDELLAELRGAGWADARALDASAVARPWRLPHADAPTQMVVFVAESRG